MVWPEVVMWAALAIVCVVAVSPAAVTLCILILRRPDHVQPPPPPPREEQLHAFPVIPLGSPKGDEPA